MPHKLKFQHRKKCAGDARPSTKASCSSMSQSVKYHPLHILTPEVGSDISSEMSSPTSSESQVMEPLSRHHLRMLILH